MNTKELKYWERTKHKVAVNTEIYKETMLLSHAKCWQRVYALKSYFFTIKAKNKQRLALLFLTVPVLASIVTAVTLQGYFESYFSHSSRFDSIKALFLTLGGALIGATAIAFSLIMFAMQVNVERMPHGLFRKFSSDIKLLSSFVTTFLLAAITAGLSIIPNESWVAGAISTALWCFFLIILLFVLAYRRALSLISPTMQLQFVVLDSDNNFKHWDSAIKRTMPILRANLKTLQPTGGMTSHQDIYRFHYFRTFPHWTAQAEQAISYCLTFSKRYAEVGDYEVSKVALNGILQINGLYIHTKGKTFFSNSYLIDNPLASDSFLTHTLECLRLNVQVGISRKDEQFIEQNLHCLLGLTKLYLSIDYGDEHAKPSHAHLVSGYLTGALESIVPHDMADVLIEGVSILGDTARHFVIHEPQFVATISEKIALVACTGVVNKKYQVVSQVAVKKLAVITFDLLRCESTALGYEISEVRDDLRMIATMYLEIPETPLAKVHSKVMAAYYSGTSNDSLMSWLTDLTNELITAEGSDQIAHRVIDHIVEWSDGLYRTEKELLLLAIEKKSHFTFDMIHWVVHITKLLLAISSAGACHEHNSDKLRKSAKWLIYVLSWIPDNEETLRYVETYRIADNIFDSAFDAHKSGCIVEAIEIRDLLLSWACKVGKYQTGWASLEKACCGLACLNIILGLSDEKLFNDIEELVSMANAPDIEMRSKAASYLRKEAGKYRSGYGHGHIDAAMAGVDQSRLISLLNGVANHIYPEVL